MDTVQQNNINCRSKMNKYLMNRNAAYRLRIPISFLIAIVVSIFMKNAQSINNFFIAHILIPVAVFLIVWFSIDIGVRNTVSKKRLNMLEHRCNQFINPIEKQENFVTQEESERKPTIMSVPKKNNEEVKQLEKVHNITDYVSTDKHNLKPQSNKPVLPKNIRCESSSKDEDKYNHENTNYLNPTKRYYSSFPLGDTYPPPLSFSNNLSETAASGCLLGTDVCSPLCSGTGKNICNLVVPIPGPQWQVQNASTVQYRLNNNMYVPNTCSGGPTILRDASDCKNLTNKNATSCADSDVKCKNSRMHP